MLNRFKTAARNSDRYVYEEAPRNHGDVIPFASRSITVDKTTFDLAGFDWAVVSKAPGTVVYGADLIRDGKPVLEIRKSYMVTGATDKDTQGYEVRLEYVFSNLTDQPLTVLTDFNGPVLPPGESNRSPDRQVMGGYIEGGSILLESHPIEEFKSDKNNGDIDLTRDSKQRAFRWIGTSGEQLFWGDHPSPESDGWGQGRELGLSQYGCLARAEPGFAAEHRSRRISDGSDQRAQARSASGNHAAHDGVFRAEMARSASDAALRQFPA